MHSFLEERKKKEKKTATVRIENGKEKYTAAAKSIKTHLLLCFPPHNFNKPKKPKLFKTQHTKTLFFIVHKLVS